MLWMWPCVVHFRHFVHFTMPARRGQEMYICLVIPGSLLFPISFPLLSPINISNIRIRQPLNFVGAQQNAMPKTQADRIIETLTLTHTHAYIIYATFSHTLNTNNEGCVHAFLALFGQENMNILDVPQPQHASSYIH